MPAVTADTMTLPRLPHLPEQGTLAPGGQGGHNPAYSGRGRLPGSAPLAPKRSSGWRSAHSPRLPPAMEGEADIGTVRPLRAEYSGHAAGPVGRSRCGELWRPPGGCRS